MLMKVANQMCLRHIRISNSGNQNRIVTGHVFIKYALFFLTFNAWLQGNSSTLISLPY